MDKFVHIPLFTLSWLFLFVTNFENPRFFIIAFILLMLTGIGRYGYNYLNGEKSTAIMFVASISVGFAMGCLGILAAAYFLPEGGKFEVGLFFAGATSTFFGRDIIKWVQFFAPKWGGKQIGVEISDEQTKEITKQKPSPRRKT